MGGGSGQEGENVRHPFENNEPTQDFVTQEELDTTLKDQLVTVLPDPGSEEGIVYGFLPMIDGRVAVVKIKR